MRRVQPTEGMEKMNEAIRPRNAKATVLLAVLVLLVLALASLMRPAETTGASSPGGRAIPAVSAGGTGGTGLNDDPYINRHAEVVARYQQDGPR